MVESFLFRRRGGENRLMACKSSFLQVESLTIRPERPLVVMSMTRPRRSFGLPCKLVDRDAYDWLTDDYMAKVKQAKELSIPTQSGASCVQYRDTKASALRGISGEMVQR